MDTKGTYFSERHWDNVASVRVLETTSCSRALIRSLRECCGALEGRRVLDMGTGGGAMAVDFVRHGAEVTGVDVSSIGLEAAARSADGLLGTGAERQRLRFLKMDANALDFAPASFDVATFLKAIWCFHQPEACLAECHRVLAPGGRIAIQLWGRPEDSPLLMAGSLSIHRAVPASAMPTGARSPFEFTPESMERRLTAAGFTGFMCTRYQARFELPTVQAFWELFHSVAGTAFYVYASQPEDRRAVIDAAWQEYTRPFRTDSGSVVLPLQWCIVSAGKA